MTTVYYEDATGFIIGAIVVTIVICVAIVRWPPIAQAMTRMYRQPKAGRPFMGFQPDLDAQTTDQELQELEVLRDKGQISEETFLARQAILARRKR